MNTVKKVIILKITPPAPQNTENIFFQAFLDECGKPLK
jgi:hypothetical protein